MLSDLALDERMLEVVADGEAEMVSARRLVVRFRVAHTYDVVRDQPPGG
jgi:hypothetical protein